MRSITDNLLVFDLLISDPYLSFSAWIAISMGGGLVISILVGRAYMSFRHNKGRSQVKQMIVEAITGDKKKKKEDVSWKQKSFTRFRGFYAQSWMVKGAVLFLLLIRTAVHSTRMTVQGRKTELVVSVYKVQFMN